MPVGNHLPHGETAQGGPLKRELGERHIRLMALGACIGVGLFLGSAKAIEMAGPAIMLSYICLLYTSPSPRDRQKSRMPSSA